MIIDRFLPNPMGGFFIQRSCSCGGIGIHNRLKICRPYGLASSSLAGSMVIKIEGPVAQLGERLICIQEVIGSIPFRST